MRAGVQELGLEEEEEVAGAMDRIDYLHVLPVLRAYNRRLRKLFRRSLCVCVCVRVCACVRACACVCPHAAETARRVGCSCGSTQVSFLACRAALVPRCLGASVLLSWKRGVSGNM